MKELLFCKLKLIRSQENMNPKHKDDKFTRDLQQDNNNIFINVLTPIHDGDGFKSSARPFIS